MQVERCWILAAKKLSAQATEAELDEFGRYNNMQAHITVLSVLFNNVKLPAGFFKKDATNLLERINCINSYTNLFFTNETTTNI